MSSPIIPWMGGKRRLADRLIPLFPPHECYVEVFAGGGALYFLRPQPAPVEVLNDINGDLVTLYRVVQNHLEEFVRQFKWALSSRQIFEWQKMTCPETLTDIPGLVGFLANLPEYSAELFANQKSKSTLETSRLVLENALPLLENLETWSNESLFELLKTFSQEQGLKVGTVMWPIRTALSGQETSPGGATELAALLGKPESLRRLGQGLKKLS